MDLVVKFDGNILSPTPTVSRSYQFLDYGKRFGQIEQIELNSYISGIVGTNNNITNLIQNFGGQFKTLEVFQNAVSIYRWDNIVLQEINIPQNNYPQFGFIPYNAKFISYSVPSGVTNPSNEYSFSQGEDGVVTVTHKVSAKGFKTNSGALDNAIGFVKNFIRKNPFDSCIPTFIPNSSGILFNVSETIDRAACTYSISEVYKYSTGIGSQYLQTESISIDESKTNDYPTIELDIKIQGSPVDKNIDVVKSAAISISPESILQNYGIITTGIFRNSFTVSEDTGQCLIEIRSSFFSGNNTDYSGFFDYGISCEEDSVTNIRNWRIDGNYLVKGPIELRNSRISSFKTANQGNDGFNTYLSGLIINSYLFSTVFTGHSLNFQNLEIIENTGVGQFQLSASYSDYDTTSGLVNPKYSIECEPSKWLYEIAPAANIEGNYSLQDLQMKTKAKIRFSVNAGTTGTTREIGIISGIADTLSGIYVGNAFMSSQNISSGKFNCEISEDYIGDELQAQSLLTSKVYGSFGNGYVRQHGFSFGY